MKAHGGKTAPADGADRGKDDRAFLARALAEHRTIMFGYIVAHTGDPDRAEDIYQEACATLWEKIGEFQKGTNFKAWAMQVVRFKILSSCRDRSREGWLTGLDPELAEAVCDDRAWTEEEEPFSREREALQGCLGKLSGTHRDILLGRYGRGWPAAELAKRFQRTVGSIHVILSRLRDALEDCIRKRIDGATA